MSSTFRAVAATRLPRRWKVPAGLYRLHRYTGSLLRKSCYAQEPDGLGYRLRYGHHHKLGERSSLADDFLYGENSRIFEIRLFPEGATLAERLVTYRKSRGLRQKDFDRQLGIDPSTLASHEHGHKAPVQSAEAPTDTFQCEGATAA